MTQSRSNRRYSNRNNRRDSTTLPVTDWRHVMLQQAAQTQLPLAHASTTYPGTFVTHRMQCTATHCRSDRKLFHSTTNDTLLFLYAGVIRRSCKPVCLTKHYASYSFTSTRLQPMPASPAPTSLLIKQLDIIIHSKNIDFKDTNSKRNLHSWKLNWYNYVRLGAHWN